MISQKAITFALTCLGMISSGSLSTYSLLSESMKQSFMLNINDINLIASVGNTALYVTFIAIGPFYDYFGENATMVLATVTASLGYLLVWLAYCGLVSATTASMCIYFFLVGFGNNATYMVGVGISSVNFTAKYYGIMTGILLLFYGISGTIFSQIFSAMFSNYVPGFVLLLTIVTFIINLLGALFIRKIPEKRISVEQIEVGISSKTTQELQETTSLVKRKGSLQMTPKQMLMDPCFWLYLTVCVFAQGLTYMSNISSIVIAAIGTTDSNVVASNAAIQITLISISQAVGRLAFGALSDVVVNKFHYKRELLLIIGTFLGAIPLAILALGSSLNIDISILSLCSVLIGAGFGAVGGLFPLITKDLFGTRFYGTACSFLLSPVPIGILISNLVFASCFNMAIEKAGTSNCFGPSCFSLASQYLLGIQLIAFCCAIALYRLGKKNINTIRE